MKVLIDAVGDHDPQWCHMVVDGVGALVDLSDCPGPLSDPHVTTVEWGFFGANYTQSGLISRRHSTNASSMIEQIPFSDIGMIGSYLTAYKARIEKVHQVS